MKRLFLIITAIASLSGCASREQLAARDDDKCRSYGLAPGDQGYAQCRMNLDMLRLQARQQAANAVAAGLAAGVDRAGQVYSSPPQQTYSPPQSAWRPSSNTASCAEGYRCDGRTQQADGTWR